MEIIRIANGDYGKYEDLLLYRDSLRKEAEQYFIEYIRQFGELINKVYEKKIECIKLKKAISFVQASINKNGFADIGELNEYLSRVMEEYNKKLEMMVNDYNAVRNSGTAPEYEVLKIKKIYRRIAKQIHPDICPVISQHPEFGELWNRVQIAYSHNNLKEIEELEVIISKALEDAGIESVDVLIPDIYEKIKEVESEIEKITSTDPYLFGELLRDDEAVREKTEELEEELAEYEEYRQSLQEHLDSILG
ncbi:MAG: hypothetical protein IK085_00250 [Clostridia bacterium]|nr:hypothetical protein [Clostridia bacterium]